MGIGGGLSYDAVIAACAAEAGADSLLTFNPRHFDPPPRGVAILEPDSSDRTQARQR
jgi:predicted nucleic acid-binding protein